MGVGSHVVCNCPLPEIHLSIWQVGRIPLFCEDGWIEIGFNTNTGPWIQPEDDDPNVPAGWPFSLLHASCDVSVDLNGISQAPTLFDVESDWELSKAKASQRQGKPKPVPSDGLQNP